MDATYRELAASHGVPVGMVLAVHDAIGFASPDPDERAGPDDVVMAELIRTILDTGESEAVVRRLFRLYGDNLRRIATGEADLYVAELEKQWRESGAGESELMRHGSDTGRRMQRSVASNSWRSTTATGSTSGPTTPSARPRRPLNGLVCSVVSTGFPRSVSSI